MSDDEPHIVAVRDVIDVVASCLDAYSDQELVSIRAVVLDVREKAPYLTQSDDELAEIASIQAVARGMNVISFDAR
jgi:hypothetical protein